MTKVKSERIGIVHAYAQCEQCDFDAAIKGNKYTRMQNMRNKIYAHVKKTGHKVVLETGNAFYYSLEK